jgi:hypothetical protein
VAVLEAIIMENIISDCKLMIHPDLPKGEEKAPFEGFRGRLLQRTFNLYVN